MIVAVRHPKSGTTDDQWRTLVREVPPETPSFDGGETSDVLVVEELRATPTARAERIHWRIKRDGTITGRERSR